ncbi:hypothetical protein E2C01_039292 [Portunus trituberculatus]|uniref:Uncharacterized protein n=1 Tax=Portunus trituberculatus TaxID=210409 RepID=A0A5B7FJA4_PORTR|nr:hypothetical protein [Portunus trituberculatus]
MHFCTSVLPACVAEECKQHQGKPYRSCLCRAARGLEELDIPVNYFPDNKTTRGLRAVRAPLDSLLGRKVSLGTPPHTECSACLIGSSLRNSSGEMLRWRAAAFPSTFRGSMLMEVGVVLLPRMPLGETLLVSVKGMLEWRGWRRKHQETHIAESLLEGGGVVVWWCGGAEGAMFNCPTQKRVIHIRATPDMPILPSPAPSVGETDGVIVWCEWCSGKTRRLSRSLQIGDGWRREKERER